MTNTLHIYRLLAIINIVINIIIIIFNVILKIFSFN